MKGLIIDVVSNEIAVELGKYMDIKVSEKLPPSKAELIEQIADVDVLIMRVDPKIDREVLDAAQNLKVIGVCSVGLNHIDTKYAEEKGIKVFNAPGLNGNAVAELTISKMVKKQLRVSGIVNSEPAVLQGLDKTHEEKSDVIPVEYKKDGSLSSRSTVMNREEIETLQKYARKKVEFLGKEIAEGNIAMSPAVFKDRDSCTFCQFKEVCSFDPRLQGHEKKELEELDSEAVWKEIRTAVKEEI